MTAKARRSVVDLSRATYHRVPSTLLSEGERMKRPSDIELLEHLTGTPSNVIAELAEKDASVRQRLSEMTSMMDSLSHASVMEAAFDVPDGAIGRIAASTCPAPAPVRPSLGDATAARVRKVLTLVFDSFTAPQTARQPALRTGSATRRLVAEGPGLRLDLELTATKPAVEGVTPGEVHILGRVEADQSVVSIRAQRDGRADAAAEVDDAGFFELVVAPGQYDLVCGLEAGEAAAESLDLRA